jgi:hypothetical protein
MNEIQLPPPYCSGICSNAMNDVCVENCALKKDMSAFELKKGVELSDLPPFPLDEFIHTMTPKERQVVMAVYMAKAVDFIQGRKGAHNDHSPSFSRRPIPHPEGSNGDHRHEEVNDLPQNPHGDGVLQVRQAFESEVVGPNGVDGDEESGTVT